MKSVIDFTTRKTIKKNCERRNKTKHIEMKRIITRSNLLKTKHYKFKRSETLVDQEHPSAIQSCKNYYINLCTPCRAHKSEVHSIHRPGARRAKKGSVNL